MSGIATAVVGSAVVGSYLSGKAQKDAAETAANAQDRASQLSIEEQQRQFDEIRKTLEPFVKTGTLASQAQASIAGLRGPLQQKFYIDAMIGSPQYTSIVKSGEDAILQNAAATGGLRGGNTQAALAQYRPQILSQLLESQFNKLGGLSSLGQNAAAGVGNAGQSSSNAIQQALMTSGDARAQAALASGRAQAQNYNTLATGLGQAAGYYFGSGTDTGAVNQTGGYTGSDTAPAWTRGIA